MKLYTQDTKKIESAHRFLQTINIVSFAILSIVAVIASIILLEEWEEITALLPLVALAIYSLIFFSIKSNLEIKFGMYYDIRVLRMAYSNTEEQQTDEELPEL